MITAAALVTETIKLKSGSKIFTFLFNVFYFIFLLLYIFPETLAGEISLSGLVSCNMLLRKKNLVSGFSEFSAWLFKDRFLEKKEVLQPNA